MTGAASPQALRPDAAAAQRMRGARRSLWPREHGAYVQLLAPMAAALATSRPTAAGLLIAAGACLAFLAHEPLLVVLGHRGRRLQAEAGARARTRLAVLGAAAIACGAPGLALSSGAGRAVAALVAVPAAVLVVLAWRRRVRSLLGETVAAVALSGAAAPIAVAAGAPVSRALLAWLAWSVGFGATVIAVHRVIARHRRPWTIVDGVAAAALALVTAAAVVASSRVTILWAVVPLSASSALVVLRPPPATRLRAIGVALTAAALASAALVHA